jgi:hypothetical protein
MGMPRWGFFDVKINGRVESLFNEKPSVLIDLIKPDVVENFLSTSSEEVRLVAHIVSIGHLLALIVDVLRLAVDGDEGSITLSYSTMNDHYLFGRVYWITVRAQSLEAHWVVARTTVIWALGALRPAPLSVHFLLPFQLACCAVGINVCRAFAASQVLSVGIVTLYAEHKLGAQIVVERCE